jgi:hypothetical protein
MKSIRHVYQCGRQIRVQKSTPRTTGHKLEKSSEQELSLETKRAFDEASFSDCVFFIV